MHKPNQISWKTMFITHNLLLVFLSWMVSKPINGVLHNYSLFCFNVQLCTSCSKQDWSIILHVQPSKGWIWILHKCRSLRSGVQNNAGCCWMQIWKESCTSSEYEWWRRWQRLWLIAGWWWCTRKQTWLSSVALTALHCTAKAAGWPLFYAFVISLIGWMISLSLLCKVGWAGT